MHPELEPHPGQSWGAAGEMISLTPADALQAQLGLFRFCYIKVAIRRMSGAEQIQPDAFEKGAM